MITKREKLIDEWSIKMKSLLDNIATRERHLADIEYNIISLKFKKINNTAKNIDSINYVLGIFEEHKKAVEEDYDKLKFEQRAMEDIKKWIKEQEGGKKHE